MVQADMERRKERAAKAVQAVRAVLDTAVPADMERRKERAAKAVQAVLDTAVPAALVDMAAQAALVDTAVLAAQAVTEVRKNEKKHSPLTFVSEDCERFVCGRFATRAEIDDRCSFETMVRYLLFS